jgi:hypothetical protein
MKKILLTGLFAFLLCPVANAQTYLSPWSNGIEVDEAQAKRKAKKNKEKLLPGLQITNLRR